MKNGKFKHIATSKYGNSEWKLPNWIYQFTKTFPDDERFGLISQLRRAAVSIPANIAEGNARDSTKEYLRHLSIAVGSLAEIETLLDLAHRLHIGQTSALSTLVKLIGEERRMLRGLQRSIRAKLNANCPIADL